MKRLIKPTIALCCGTLFIMTTIVLMGASSPLEQTEHATLRIYNKGYYAGFSSGFGVKINDQMVVKRLKGRSWVDVKVPVATLTLETVPEFGYPTYVGKTYSLKTEAGNLYYLEAVLDYEFLTSTMHLVLREKSRAETEMKRLKQENNVIQKLE
ncbi:MAG: hypothetical protein R3D00_31355 [Bacteroidia bacterium]